MKKIITLILILTLVCSSMLAVPVFAEGGVENEIYEDIDHPWENGNSYIEQGPDGSEIVYLQNGSIDVILERGIAMSISNCSEGVVAVMIYPFDNDDGIAAWNWFMDIIGKGHKSAVPIDIVFLNEEGSALENAQGNVELIIPSSFDDPVLYEVNADGDIKESFNVIIHEGVAKFRANNNYYYILAEKSNNLPIVILVTVISVAAVAGIAVLAVFIVKKKRKASSSAEKE